MSGTIYTVVAWILTDNNITTAVATTTTTTIITYNNATIATIIPATITATTNTYTKTTTTTTKTSATSIPYLGHRDSVTIFLLISLFVVFFVGHGGLVVVAVVNAQSATT